MTTAICTLFEGDYHYGVGALCNSLYQSGFRGVIYAGHRGPLPPWAAGAVERGGYLELTIAPSFLVHFVSLTTEVHFARYKPDFMLSLWRDHCPGADALFYFDPDITCIGRWPFFEDWVQCGVAICADSFPDMPASHPLRHAWLRYFGQHDIQFIREQNVYFNSGFVGVAKQNVGFLEMWRRLIQLLEPATGRLRRICTRDRSFLFHVPDQDALNVATMACQEPVSYVGVDGMDFRGGGGGYMMSHVLGPKPWRKKTFWRVLAKAQPPTRADKAFLRYASAPIRLYGPLEFRLKKLDLLAASALGRFMR